MDRAEPNISKRGTRAGTQGPLSRRWRPSTLISGTTILDSGFLSNMRVIRSFKSSAMSGLGGGDTSWVGHRKLRNLTAKE